VKVLDQSEVEVPGGWVVNFLFPVWPPVTEESAARQTEIAAYVVGMRLEAKPRLERLAALGAALEPGAPTAREGLVARLRRALPDGKELGFAVGWSVIALAGVVLLVAITLGAASVLLIGLWYLLQWITDIPRWLAGQIGDIR
jgi:hypothetical protein